MIINITPDEIGFSNSITKIIINIIVTVDIIDKIKFPLYSLLSLKNNNNTPIPNVNNVHIKCNKHIMFPTSYD